MEETKTYKPNLAVRRRESLERLETRERQRISNLSAILTVMVKAVQKAGRSVVRDFGEVGQLQVREKGAGDFVSETDLRVEQILMESLALDRPDYGFICEETGEIPAKNDSPFTWIIDPIDGTTNFIHGFPFFAISLALRYRDEITAGVLYNPITNDLFYAEKGEGFFLMTPNGSQRLRVAGRRNLQNALIAVGHKDEKMLPLLNEAVSSFRHFGSHTLELAYVGAGRLDGVVLNRPLIWDIATAILFVKEAGGCLTNEKGQADLRSLMNAEYIVAGNLSVNEKIRKLMR